MSRVFTGCVAYLVVAMAASGELRAADRSELSKLKTALAPKKSVSPGLRGSECVQKVPELALWDGKTRVAPSVAGSVFVVLRNEGNRLLVSDLNGGGRAWVTPEAIVPLSKAEVYFSGQIKANPRSAFAYLMRGVARLENDDLDGASADLDQSLKLDAKYVPALIARAQLWQWRNRLDQAIADASKAIELDERNCACVRRTRRL